MLVNGHVVLRDQKGSIRVFYTTLATTCTAFDKPVVCNAPLYFDVHADLDKHFLVNDGRTMHELPPGSVVRFVAEEVAYARRKWQGKTWRSFDRARP